ncbi:MAG: N-6 DNA methylase [Methanoregula sp.]|nr:N-6 DNA methylase [Methanoregula sp.]
MGLPIRAEKSEWLKLAAGDGLLENSLGQYFDLFKNADSFGSLIQIHDERTLVPHEMLMQKLDAALAKEKAIGDPVAEAFGETASGVLKAVSYVRRIDYDIVVTNPPFLGYRKQNSILQQYCDIKYPNSNTDLATSFIERCNSFVKKGGIYGLVTPQNWLFLTTYKNLRTIYLNNQTFNTVARLGANAFETIGGAVVQVALVTLTNNSATKQSVFLSADLSESKSSKEKSKNLEYDFKRLCQKDQLNNPDARIGMDPNLNNNEMLDKYCYSAQGIGTTDNPHYVIKFWEIEKIQGDWVYFQTANKSNCFIGGYHSLFKWGQEYFDYIKLLKSQNRIGGGWQAGRLAWNHKGFTINVTGAKNITLFSGQKFDTTIGAIIPHEEKYLEPIFYYLISPNYLENLLKIDPTLSITEGTLIKVPFDLPHWQKIAEEMGPLPKPHSDDPTQWLFKGNIVDSKQPLHVAIARMLGYRWPEQPAGEDPLDALIDKDGIVCIPPVWGERPAGDWLRSILSIAYGSKWSPRMEEELLKQAGYTKSGGLEGFLRDEFFASHSKLFHQRPFIWQVWDGTKDGFSALVNYHKLDHNTLQKLIYTYLGNWITQQKDDVKQEKPGAERRLAAAEALKGNLEKILEGEKPFDIYVRWKPLRVQAIGWEPDLNDGVRMNIRPFIEAGALRWTPNIKWGKDRGTDPVPNCSGTTERLNDLHFSLEEKKKAREDEVQEKS